MSDIEHWGHQGVAMARKTSLIVELTEEERGTLGAWQRSTTMRAGLAKRGRTILLRAEGVPVSHIASLVGMRRRHVEKWVKRFLARRLDGLADKAGRGRKPFFPSGSSRALGQACLRAS